MTDWASYRALSRWSLLVRFALLGAFAGLAAWALVWPLHLFLDVNKPSVLALLLAIPRGALFGVLLALFLHWRWHRRGHTNQT